MAKSQNDRAVIDLVINGKQAQTSLKEVSLAVTNARSALNKMKETDPGYKDRLKELHALLAAQRQMTANINQTTTAWGRFKANAASTATGLIGGNLISAGISAAANAIPAIIAKYRQFDAASKELSAVTGATGADLDYLNKTAAKSGPTFGKSGAEMLEAYKLMASAKPELLAQKELLTQTTEAAITLSQAGKIDLAQATQVTAESLNQFGESADQANRFINVIAAGAKEGSAEIADMGIALKNSGTVAKAQGVSFEQTNAVLQSLSTIALKGGEAGTQFRNVLLTLGSGANDTNPKIVGLEKALENLGKKNLSTAEMTKLFGKENITAAQHIITHRNEISELTKRVTGTQEAFSQAEKNNQSLDHQLEIFWARVEGLAIILGTKLVPAFTKVVEAGIRFTNFLSGNLSPASEAASEAFEKQKSKVEGLTKNIAPLLERYDKLKEKSTLTTDEQVELNKIIDQVAKTIPSAVTQFDAYGKAMDINTGKARQAIEVQQELLQHYNKTAIAETTTERDRAIEDLQRAIDKRKAGMTVDEDTSAAGGGYRKMTEEELLAVDAEIEELKNKLQERNNLLKGLTGYDAEARRRARRQRLGEKVGPEEPTEKPTNDKPSGSGGGLSDEEQKKLDKRKEANKDAILRIQKMKVDAIAEDEKREIAQAEYESDLAKARVKESVQDENLKHQEITAINDRLTADLLKIQQKYDKQRKEEAEKVKLEKFQDMKSVRDQIERELVTENQLRLQDIEQAAERGLITEDAARMAKLQAENAFLLAKRALYKKYYDDVKELDIQSKDKLREISDEQKAHKEKDERDLTQNLNAQVDARLAHAESADEKMFKSQLERQQAIRDVMQETLNLMQVNWDEQLSGLRTFWQKATTIQKAAFVASKAYAVAEATVAYATTLMSMWQNAKNPLVAIGYSALATATYGTVLGKIASANYNVPTFAQGGFTNGPGGYVDGPTLFQMGNRRFIAGEAGREFVISNRALQNPVVANFARIMDVAQKSGNYGMLQSGVTGGSPALPAPTPQAALPAGMSHEMGMAILQQLQRNNELMDKYANRSIIFDYRLFEQYQKEVQQIRASNSL
ncbi:hypothetical protein GCM10028805_57550 [Spirosoma harenae]